MKEKDEKNSVQTPKSVGEEFFVRFPANFTNLDHLIVNNLNLVILILIRSIVFFYFTFINNKLFLFVSAGLFLLFHIAQIFLNNSSFFLQKCLEFFLRILFYIFCFTIYIDNFVHLRGLI